jgi:hypothetical protein
MLKANKQILLDYHTDIKDSLTISSLATRILLNKYYHKIIPAIHTARLYKDIKKAYGG